MVHGVQEVLIRCHYAELNAETIAMDGNQGQRERAKHRKTRIEGTHACRENDVKSPGCGR